MTNDADDAFAAEREVARINAFFPILPRLGNHLAGRRSWEEQTVVLNLHLTTLTAGLARELTLGGGTFVFTAASPKTTDRRVVSMLRDLGMQVYTGGDMEDRHLQALEHRPDLIVDTGLELTRRMLERRPQLASKLTGVVELTRSGIHRLRGLGELSFPVVNISDGRLKNAVENRHGVGDAIWRSVTQLTGMHLSGRRVAVIGYGPVGRGLAAHARAAGMSVEVVEADPIRRLFAHYDGYPTPLLSEALARVGIAVTATGASRVLQVDDLTHARDGIVLLNAGKGGTEIDVQAIRRAAVAVDHVSEEVVTYRLEQGPRVVVLADGHPLNIVLNAGSPEPVLLHFAVLGLALEWLATHQAPAHGELLVPPSIEDQAALFALESLNIAGE